MIYLYYLKFWLSLDELCVIPINHADFSEADGIILFLWQGVLQVEFFLSLVTEDVCIPNPWFRFVCLVVFFNINFWSFTEFCSYVL